MAHCKSFQGRGISMSPRSKTAAPDRRWIALAVLVAAQFMVVLDVAIVNVALPSIKTDLHFTQESLQWVITAYAIMFGEGRERNIALGVWGAVSGSGAAAGVLLGGLLTSSLDWSWIFFINVPVGAAVVALSPFLLRESRAGLAHRTFDVAGAASVTRGGVVVPFPKTPGAQD